MDRRYALFRAPIYSRHQENNVIPTLQVYISISFTSFEVCRQRI